MLEIIFSKRAEKDLGKAPKAIQEKVLQWKTLVERLGLFLTRQTMKGLHDEPLSGQRKGQRSIRLNKQWRLIYEEKTGILIEIQELTAHDYRTR